MLRKRKLSLAGIAVGALALMVSTSVPLAYGHGWTNSPISRAKLCQNGAVQNCGQIQWEPQSVEGPKGFPASGPADGVLCSAGLSQFHELDDQRGGAWPATQLTAGAGYTFAGAQIGLNRLHRCRLEYLYLRPGREPSHCLHQGCSDPQRQYRSISLLWLSYLGARW